MEGRVPIPWIAYVIIGALISIYSKFVQLQDPDNTVMTIFFYIGIALAVVGVGKYLIKRKVNDETKTYDRESQNFQRKLQDEQRKLRQRQQKANERLQEHSQQNPQRSHNQHSIVACSRCGTRHYSSSNFCHKCGSRLK